MRSAWKLIHYILNTNSKTFLQFFNEISTFLGSKCSFMKPSIKAIFISIGIDYSIKTFFDSLFLDFTIFYQSIFINLIHHCDKAIYTFIKINYFFKTCDKAIYTFSKIKYLFRTFFDLFFFFIVYQRAINSVLNMLYNFRSDEVAAERLETLNVLAGEVDDGGVSEEVALSYLDEQEPDSPNSTLSTPTSGKRT